MILYHGTNCKIEKIDLKKCSPNKDFGRGFYLWFVAIHPFDDGNGRLTRTLTDMLIARSTGMQCYSVSAEIMKSRKDYYTILERTTCGDMDISELMD